jgi:protein arginine kinase
MDEMQIADLIHKPGEWLKGQGPDSNIVVSSRIRLARNFEEFYFPIRQPEDDARILFLKVQDGVKKSAVLRELHFFDFAQLSSLQRDFLHERHLVSREFASEPEGRALLLRKDEVISVMVNEEDHLRIQVIKSGFDLQNTWELANRLDDEFSRHMKYAFTPEMGYLTSCPTNVGTGMRASCMLHLPALIMTKRINRILELLAKLMFTTRGFFGEGTQATGNFFQVSNQMTLGVSEEEVLENLNGVIRQLKSQELEAREYMYERYRLTLEDKIWRAMGILKNARVITSSEALGYLSLLRLGADMGILKGLDIEPLNNLLITIQPAHLQKVYKKKLSHDDRDAIRSTYIRNRLNELNV